MSYVHASSLYSTKQSALAALFYDYATACGANSAREAIEWITSDPMSDFEWEIPKDWGVDDDDINEALEIAYDRLWGELLAERG